MRARVHVETHSIREPARELRVGRVDLARDDDGAPMVMELELIEPSLFFLQNPVALDRFVTALLRAPWPVTGASRNQYDA